MLKWFRLRSLSFRKRLWGQQSLLQFTATVHVYEPGNKNRNPQWILLFWVVCSSAFVFSVTRTAEDRALRWAGRGHRMENSGQCLTTQLNNEASTCSWLDKQEASMAACCRGLELDRELHVMLRSNKTETVYSLIISGLTHKKWQAQANGRQVMKLKMNV